MIKSLGGGKYKIIVTVRGKFKKKEATFQTSYSKPCLSAKIQAEKEALRLKTALIQKNKDWLCEKTGWRSLKIGTFGDALKLWLNTPQKNGKSRTLKKQEYRYNVLMDKLGHLPVNRIYGGMMEFRKSMAVKVDKGELAPGTVNRYITLAKSAVNCAYNHRVEDEDFKRAIPENYLSQIPMLPEDNIEYLILTDQDRLRLWNYLPDILKPLYYFACRIPMRLSELLSLRRVNIDQVNGFIYLSGSNTKNGIGRQIKIMPELKTYVNSINGEFLFDVPRHTRKDGTIDFGGYKLWYKAVKEAGINKRYNFHKTRQEAVMGMYQEGCTKDQIMRLGGWRSEAAFNRYFIPEVAIHIDQNKKEQIIDTSWYQKFAPDLTRVA